MQNAKRAESMSNHAFSQFKLTTNTITKLNTFKLTPTAKLVLLYLTTCYNPKHKEVFPKQKTIADKLGISEVSVTRAISELHKEGLIISERKISNRYVFTSRIVSEQADILIDDKQQIDSNKNIKLIDSHVHEQIKRTKKEPTLCSGENVLTGDDFILYEYAKKKAKYNVDALVRKIKENGGDKKIIKEYKAKEYAKKRALRSVKESQSLIKYYEEMRNNCVTAAECGCSLAQIRAKIKA